MRGRVACLVCLLLAVSAPSVAIAAPQQQTDPDLRALSLEALMQIPVSTVARLPQPRLLAPASVFVITQDDIRRSGATSVPEVLRLAPGVHVAQIDGVLWAVGIRGFADRLSRSMLVLVDGRAVYSPLFAGTYWEVQDLPLEDIERIEVVRGPGGSLWGANAVNGIINIIRKSAAASAGSRVTVGSGTEDPVLLEAGYGGSRGPAVQYRVSGKIARRSAQAHPTLEPYDDGTMVQGGARVDWTSPARGAFTLQGDAYRTVIGQRDALVTYSPPGRSQIVTDNPLTGANVLFRWSGPSADPRAPRLQLYFDRSTRSELVFDERQHIYDADYQQGRSLGRHGLLWGAGYRVVDSDTDTRGTLAFTPPDVVDHLVTAFVQDEIAVVPDRLALIAGARLERNEDSGVEWQPSVRAQWTISPAHAVSASVTRAVRTPSRVEQDFESGNLLSAAGPVFVRLQPNPAFEPEELIAYEAGLVTMPHPDVLATVALFRNQHDRVMSTELLDRFVESDQGGSRVIVPVTFANGLKGYSYGLEATADVRVKPWLRITGAYSGLRVHLSRRPASTDLTQELRAEGGSPRHQVVATATVNPASRLRVDWFYRFVSELPDVGVPAYGTSNLRLAWSFRDDLSVFAIGTDLHDDQHAEFEAGANGIFSVERAVFFGVRWAR